MSAAPVLHDLAEAPERRAPRGGRGHLRLVHEGELAQGHAPVAPLSERDPKVSRPRLRVLAAHEVPAAAVRVAPARVAPARGRITRRGRLVLTGTVTLLLAVTVAAVIGSVLPAGASSVETVVVQPGQTLSEIAATQLPDLSVNSAIVQIQLANDMNSLQVQAGQVLEIPGN